jgi:hypothetical protein
LQEGNKFVIDVIKEALQDYEIWERG